MIGKTISHYKILSKLGEGGMGVVYKAQDTKLDREVALKFLPTTSLTTEEEKARFEQEAKAAAKLSHANIATVHAIDEVDGQTFIAMEFVDGETLSDMVAERPLKIKDAIKIAKQIAEGLHMAHEQGIVHRDIKSANIMITQKGAVKIMDFGLAKLSKASMMTKAGTTLGTISYMSPEQTQGEKVDHRSDIWSLGVVLYEMVSGQLPFKGDYESAIIYSIMNEDPEPLTAVRTGVPMKLEEIVNKMLAKEPAQRYQNIVELPVDLGNVTLKETQSAKSESSTISAITREKELNVKVKYSFKTLLTIAVTALLTFSLTWFIRPGPPPPEPEPVKKTVVPLPDDVSFYFANSNRLAISPDETKIVFIGDGPESRDRFLYMKETGSFDAVKLAGTEGALSPFFSPDGRWLGYFDSYSNEVRKISVDGGEPLTIASKARNKNGATWAPDNTIIFAGSSLKRVSESGGEATFLIEPKSQEFHGFPHMLPDGQTVLFTLHRFRSRSLSEYRLAVYTLGDDDYRIILDEEGYNGVYSPTGHILYGRADRLMAVAFDLETLSVSGVPVPVLDNVATGRSAGMSYALSRKGTMLYVPGTGAADGMRSVVEVDLTGQASKFLEQQKVFQRPRYSPDGRYVGFLIEEDEVADIWIHHVNGGAMEQLTHYDAAQQSDNSTGVRSIAWSPDSKWLVYSDYGGETRSIYVIPVDGSAPAKKIYASPLEGPIAVYTWTPSGLLSFSQSNDRHLDFDLFVYSFKDSSVTTYLTSPNYDVSPVFSPNGKWIVYGSNVAAVDARAPSRNTEVYVRPYPESTAGYWKISTNGGAQPVWSADGKRIYYKNENTMYAVDVTATDEFSAGKPQMIFEGDYLSIGRQWDLHPDGDRFIMIQTQEAAARQERRLYVIENFYEEIKRLVPVEGK